MDDQPGTRRRYRIVAVVPLALAGLLAGCASMPTSGPVIDVRKVQGEEPAVYAPPDPPTLGDDQLNIVDGFIDAMGSYEPNFEVAREFLTPEARAAWDPDSAGASVYEGAKPSMTEVGEGQVELAYTETGRLGADRGFEVHATGRASTYSIELHQVDGEWRIANPPPGLLISDFNFRREFRSYNLYFFDPTFSVLVPDPVYIPRATRGPATMLARELLNGPTQWLAPAVDSAFSADAALGVESVPISSDGTATVELGNDAAATSPEARDRMAAQLTWTLSGVDGVRQVEITAGDTPLTTGETTTVATDDYRAVDPSVSQPGLPLYAVSPEGVVRIEDGEPERVTGDVGSDPDVRELAVDPAGERAVVVNEAGTTLSMVDLNGGEEPVQVLSGTDLWSPAWDRHDTIWALGVNDAGRRAPMANVAGTEVPVTVAGFDDRSVQRLEPSPDGVRVALVIGAEAYVGLIIRDVNATSQVQIVDPRPLPVAGDVHDVAWRGPDAVAVLAEDAAESGPERQIWEVPLDGSPPVSRGSVVGAVSIAAMPGNPLVVATEDGALRRQDSGVRWVGVGTGLFAPTYPQR